MPATRRRTQTYIHVPDNETRQRLRIDPGNRDRRFSCSAFVSHMHATVENMVEVDQFVEI